MQNLSTVLLTFVSPNSPSKQFSKRNEHSTKWLRERESEVRRGNQPSDSLVQSERVCLDLSPSLNRSVEQTVGSVSNHTRRERERERDRAMSGVTPSAMIDGVEDKCAWLISALFWLKGQLKIFAKDALRTPPLFVSVCACVLSARQQE